MKINRFLIVTFFAAAVFKNSYSQISNTKIGGFANVDYSITDNVQNSFGIGQYDNFITSDITDRISFLSEVVFEYDKHFILDVERVIIKYEAANWLDVKIGKIHNPLGYWNNAYHHGTLLQPTISRPLAIKFEDEGGILPIHENGLWLSGKDIGKLGFGFDLAIGNGVGDNSYLTDDNNYKAITAGLHIKPTSKLEIGLSSYFDKLYKNEIGLSGDSLIGDLSIAQGAFHLAYLGKKIEVITEYHLINNTTDTIKGKFQSNTNAAFVYAGYRVNDMITPYVIYDKILYDKKNSYFLGNGTDKYAVGLRYTFNYLANIKLELSHQTFEFGPAINEGKVSVSIGF